MTFEPLFTCVTVSIPERHELLTRAMESVRNQSYGPVPHLIRIDEPGATLSTQHVAMQRNALLPAIQTPWMAVLDDDDTFEPTYLERCAQAIEESARVLQGGRLEAAVIYTYCHGHPHAEGPFDGERLQRENFIDGEAVISMQWLRAAGEYPVNSVVEDWQLYRKIHQMGGAFVCIPERLRYHGRAQRNVTG
jgi:hypothetical protein